MKELKEYIEDVFTDYNDINEDTRIQLELINKTLAELQVQKQLPDKPRNPVGFIKPKWRDTHYSVSSMPKSYKSNKPTLFDMLETEIIRDTW